MLLSPTGMLARLFCPGLRVPRSEYGQTSSGKTYTMSGITDCTLVDIYGYIDKHKEREFILKFSAMEIYNESVRDLLSTDTSPLKLLDDPEKGTVVEKLTGKLCETGIISSILVMFCNNIDKCPNHFAAQRQIGETSLNIIIYVKVFIF